MPSQQHKSVAENIKTLLLKQQGFSFEELALALFRVQAESVPVYREYISLINVDISGINKLQNIPFLPVSLFKSYTVLQEGIAPETCTQYSSSGTTRQITSKHLVPDTGFYLKHAAHIFEDSYGPLHNFAVFALLPSYLERGGSSLVAMAQHFIEVSRYPDSGFFLEQHTVLLQKIRAAKTSGRKVLLLGVTFALLQLAERSNTDLNGVIIMETGGMKGRMREMPREEVHGILCKAFNVTAIHSEYGMTELLSQAYSAGEGVFRENYALRVLLRDPSDPFDCSLQRCRGAVNIIDLANVHSCAFVQTNDLGEKTGENRFTILGRQDNSDLRGCNLLVAV